MVVKIDQQQSTEPDSVPGKWRKTVLTNIGEQEPHDCQPAQKGGNKPNGKRRRIRQGQVAPILIKAVAGGGETYRWYSFLTNPNVATVYALVVLFVSMITAVIYLRVLRDSTRQGAR